MSTLAKKQKKGLKKSRKNECESLIQGKEGCRQKGVGMTTTKPTHISNGLRSETVEKERPTSSESFANEKSRGLSQA